MKEAESAAKDTGAHTSVIPPCWEELELELVGRRAQTRIKGHKAALLTDSNVTTKFISISYEKKRFRIQILLIPLFH